MEEEEDMLDLAALLQENSRLGGAARPHPLAVFAAAHLCGSLAGCQIVLGTHLEGLVVRLPAVTRNFYVDGHVPQPH